MQQNHIIQWNKFLTVIEFEYTEYVHTYVWYDKIVIQHASVGLAQALPNETL